MKEFINSMGTIFILMGIWSLFGGKTLSRIEGGWSVISTYNSFIGIFIGVILLVIAKKNIKKNSSKIDYSICPQCEESFTYSELQDGKCKYCKDVDTIDIKKYYDKTNNSEKI